MAVKKVFPRRQEDPLIQQLLERARQEYAQSSAIGSPSMYTAAAGGGFGPVATVLAAQTLGGIRSGTAQRQAQEIADRQQKALSAATGLQTRGYTDTPQGRVFVDNQGRLMRVADIPEQENKIGDLTVDVLKNAKYKINENQMEQVNKFIEESQGPLNEIARIANQEQSPEIIGQEDDISIIEPETTQSDVDPSIPRIPPIGLEPTTVTTGKKPSMLSRVLTGAGDTTKTYSSIDDYYLDAGFNPMEVRMNLEDRARQIRQENQSTYSSPKTYYSVDKEGKLTTANGILVKTPGQVPFIMNLDTGMRLDSSFTDKEPKGPPNTKAVYDKITGEQQFATDEQISKNTNLVPLPKDITITDFDKKFKIYKAVFTEDNNKLPPNERLTPLQIDAKAIKAASTTRTEEVLLDKVDENILGVEIPVIGNTLWEISNRGDILGLDAKIRRITEGVAGAVGKEGFASKQELESFNRLKLFKNEIIRTLALNKRYPVKEMERILSDVDIQPGVFKSKKELQSSLKSLETKLNEEKSKLIEINKSPSIDNEEKRQNLRSIADLSYFIKQIGIPKEDGKKKLKYNPQTGKMEEE